MSDKKELILHIGMGKTGTTALQNFFWSNRGVLAEHGILYPDIGVVAGAQHLLTPRMPDLLRSQGWKSLDPSRWVPKLLASPLPRVLVSTELMAWIPQAAVAPFLDVLRARFDIKICIYLRRQDNIIMAGYNQQIKAGTVMLPIGRVLQKQLARFDYVARIAPWAEALGDENILVRPYERAQFPDGDLISDFLSRVLGLGDEKGFERSTAENANPRFSPATLEFKRMVNAVMSEPARSNRFNAPLIEVGRRNDARSFEIFAEQDLLSAEQRKEILDHFAAQNAEIATRFLGRRDGVLFVEPAPVEGNVAAAPAMGDLVRVARTLDEIAPDLAVELRKLAVAGAESLPRQVQRAAAMRLQKIFASASRRDAAPTLGQGKEPLRQVASPAVVRSARPGSRRIVIHPGLPKTGTTSIQEAFHKNHKELLARHRILYPGFDENHTKAVLAMFRADSTNNLRLEGMSPRTLDRYRRKARRAFEGALARPDWQVALISGEGISTLKPAEWREFVSFLQNYAEDVSVIFGIRDGRDLLRSTIQQNLKSGMVIEGQYAKPPVFRLRGRLLPLLETFDRAKIKIWDFDRAVASEEGLLRHFCQALAIEQGAIEILVATQTFRNEGLSQSGVEALAERNRQMGARVGISEAEHRHFMMMKGPKFVLPPEVIARAEPLIAADDIWLQKVFGHRRKGSPNS